jgi:hypothetical protein
MIITTTSTMANAGPNQIVCSNTPVQLAAVGNTSGNWTGGLGTFTPNRNSSNAIYTPATSEVGTTITLTWNTPANGACPSSSAAMTITVNPAVAANAGADKFVCGSNAVTLGAIAVTGGNWTGGAGSFAPDRNTANATYTPAWEKLDRQLLLYGMYLTQMALVLVLLHLMQ